MATEPCRRGAVAPLRHGSVANPNPMVRLDISVPSIVVFRVVRVVRVIRPVGVIWVVRFSIFYNLST